ncbi:SLC13 family permease [Nocardioides sp. CFH 31398]|uniref:SLC13 family permease n=1 Tax=Nocardioides sp. CFH 31398 TaxID=2919579 RepID=UPI001F06234B|nr:SLC13 family permease [Nocardioides sp. CFH 31398]MCH1866015.1 anion permease [Nocardioides sp. CFH 31398]
MRNSEFIELTAAGRPSVPTPPPPVGGGVRRRLDGAVVPLASVLGVVVLVQLPRTLEADARAALLAFGVAVVLWSTTRLPAAWVALACAVGLTALGGAEQEDLFEALAADVVWLMVGAFVLGGAIRSTGLAGRLTSVVGRRVRTVGGATWAVTTMLVPLSVLIPSTSGRAAVMLPVHRSLTRAVDDRSVTRALSVLVPVVVLVSTICTLVGAGSHLIAVDLLDDATGSSISFGQWLLWGAPFGVAASAVSCWVVGRMFLSAELRRTPLTLPRGERRPLSPSERRTLVVTAVMVALWSTEALHGLEVAFVALAGAVVLTAPGVGVMAWKDGVAAVSWNLVVFVGAALVLGEALVDTGAAAWVVDRLFTFSGISQTRSVLLVLVVLALLTLTSHLYMTSHAARAAALVPAVLSLAASLDLDPVAVVFIGTVGMDYCLTMAVSSKALLLYAELDEETFEPADLMRLSAVLLPVHVVLVVVFYLGWWQWTGLAL